MKEAMVPTVPSSLVLLAVAAAVMVISASLLAAVIGGVQLCSMQRMRVGATFSATMSF